MSFAARSIVAEQLLSQHELPARLTAALFERHAQWQARFGDAGRERCTEDGRFHLGFLAGAVQGGRDEPFLEYVTWARALLSARGIDAAHLREHLQLLDEALAGALPEPSTVHVKRILAAACDELLRPVGSAPATAEAPASALGDGYLAAVLAADRNLAYATASSALHSGWPMARVYADLLIATQHRLGELWSATHISVAQEHMASAVTAWVMARLYEHWPRRTRPQGRVIIAGVATELHALPAQFAADLLEMRGFDVTFIGVQVPSDSILSIVREQRPDLVGLSVTMPFNLPRTVATVRALRADMPNLRIVLGGRAVRDERALARDLGVQLEDQVL